MILIRVIDYVSAIYVLTLKEVIKITSKFPNKTDKSYLHKTAGFSRLFQCFGFTKVSFEVHGIVSFAITASSQSVIAQMYIL